MSDEIKMGVQIIDTDNDLDYFHKINKIEDLGADLAY